MTDLHARHATEKLNPAARSVTVGGLRLPEISMAAVHEALALVRVVARCRSRSAEAWADSAEVLDERSLFIGREILKEIESRLSFLDSVGLDYLTLDRRANTLSGGESQRIRLATDWVSPDGCDVRARRTVHRIASARQRALARNLAGIVRPRQHPGGG